MLDRMRLMFRKELLHVVRDRRTLAMAMAMPLVMIAIIGYAYTGEIKHLPIVVINRDGSTLSWQLVSSIRETGVLDVRYATESLPQAEGLIRSGLAKAGVLIPKGFESSLETGNAYVYVVVDGSDPTSAGTISNAVAQAVQLISPTRRIRVDSIILYNPGFRYINFIAPALIGLIVQNIPTVLVAIAVSKERERGTFEQLIATPIGHLDILIGKLLTYVLIAIIDAALVIFLAVFMFDLIIRGSVILVAVFVVIYITASLGLGIIVSVKSRNQAQAIQGSMMLFIPTVFLSGAFYPLESMPAFIRPISYLIPLTHMNHALRSVMIKGVGIANVTDDLVILSIYSLLLAVIAIKLFRKRLE